MMTENITLLCTQEGWNRGALLTTPSLGCDNLTYQSNRRGSRILQWGKDERRRLANRGAEGVGVWVCLPLHTPHWDAPLPKMFDIGNSKKRILTDSEEHNIVFLVVKSFKMFSK